MDRSTALKLAFEFLWWILTAIIVWAVLQPIYKAMYIWPFRDINIIFIVVLITLTRYIFLLQHTLIARRQEVKVAFLLLMFPLAFMLIDKLHAFLSYIDEHSWEPLTGHLPFDQQPAIEAYIWGEMLFFGVGSIIAAPVFAGRMMMSVWRFRNRGTI